MSRATGLAAGVAAVGQDAARRVFASPCGAVSARSNVANLVATRDYVPSDLRVCWAVIAASPDGGAGSAGRAHGRDQVSSAASKDADQRDGGAAPQPTAADPQARGGREPVEAGGCCLDVAASST
jgi:hypothetical protein